MNPIGVFREKEIDGKPFYILTLSSQTDNPSSSSEITIGSGGELPLQPLYFCPRTRIKIEEFKREEKGVHSEAEEDGFYPFSMPPYFRKVRSKSGRKFCKLPLLPLFWCNHKEPNDEGFTCRACRNSKLGTDYYLCPSCRKLFHKECVESPLEIKHPSYPSLSLKLYNLTRTVWDCICCETFIYNVIYYCPTYKLSMHPVCALKSIPIFINHLKSHPHPLTYFPKQASLACNICGMTKEFIATYVCARCVFVVHQDCIYFPNVIRISRHPHRISFTSSLPSGNWSCGVCRKKVENDCGAYSCNSCGDYFVHSRCATRRDLWDGIELEGVPEEPEIVVEPFETIADGVVLHFSHGHHLKLKTSNVFDENNFCQACILPIYEGGYYSCMDECDFTLHEACANAPRKKYHPLHSQPLTLKVVTYEYNDFKGCFRCDACWRNSCGFVYESHVGDSGFRLDSRCASVSEPFEYQGHEHPLFLALTPKEEKVALCQICQEESNEERYTCRKLNCIECDYVICFTCATLPYKARYKHDKHFLTFQKGKETTTNQSGWCEACESKIVYSAKGGFYVCDDYCSTTLHVDCLLGDMYMKPDHTIRLTPTVVYIIRNTLSRPFCWFCARRCQHKIVFQLCGEAFCSLSCLATQSG